MSRLLLLLSLLPVVAFGAGPPLTVLFTGDNGGEIAPCG